MSLAPSGRDSRRGNHPHLFRAGTLHHAGTCLERGTCGAHVIHEDNRQALERRGHTTPQPGGPVALVPPPERERAVHVGMPLPGWKIDLWKGTAHPPEQVADGKAQVSRQQLGLIEAPPVAPRPVQRHWNSDVRTGEYLGAMMTHQTAKPRGDRLTLAVLEHMDDVAQRAVVTADGAGAIDGASTRRAARAHPPVKRVRDTHLDVGPKKMFRARFIRRSRSGGGRIGGCVTLEYGSASEPFETLAEGGQGVTAPIADGRCGRPDRRPAALADGAVPEVLKNRAARGARWGEQHQRSGFGGLRDAVRKAPPPVRRVSRAR